MTDDVREEGLSGRELIEDAASGAAVRRTERNPPALALIGEDRIEYPTEFLESAPVALRTALEESRGRTR